MMREPNQKPAPPFGFDRGTFPCFSRFDCHPGGPFRDRKTGWLGSDELGRAKASRSEDQHGTSLPLFSVQERVIFFVKKTRTVPWLENPLIFVSLVNYPIKIWWIFFLNGDFGRFTGVQGACVLLYVPLVWCLDVLKNRSRVDWKNATRGWHEFVKPLRTHKATLQQGVFLQSCGGGGVVAKIWEYIINGFREVWLFEVFCATLLVSLISDTPTFFLRIGRDSIPLRGLSRMNSCRDCQRSLSRKLVNKLSSHHW